MAVWDNGGTLGSFWGWYADVGPYTGPWPPAPPIPDNLPDTAVEVDYVVGVPDPAGYAGFAGGAFLDLWRTSSGTSFWSHGGAADPGNHLIVVFYFPGFDSSGPPPPMAPESLVPPLYAAAGSGAPVGDPATGHWVDVLLTGFPGSGTRTSSGRWFSPALVDPTSGSGWPGDSGGHSEQAWLDTWNGVITAGSVDNDPGVPDTANAGFAIDTFYAGGLYGWLTQPVGSATVRSDAWQVVTGPSLPGADSLGDYADWVANGWVDPSQLGWIEGVDYVHRPGTGVFDPFADLSEYEGTYTWGPSSLVAQPSGSIDEGLTCGYDPAVVDFDVLLSTAAPPLHSTAVPTTPDGSPLATVGATLDADQAPTTVVFTGAPNQNIAVHVRFSEALTSPPLSSFYTSGSHIAFAVNIARFTVDYLVVLGGLRMWAPGPVGGLFWHTIGGHWSSPQLMQILTPGVGWVPIVDGPA